MNAWSWFWKGLGVVCIGLAVIGAWLPLLPSTPFVLVAAWAFAKGSPTLHAKLRADPRFGPLVASIGLDRYWTESGHQPDYRRANS